MTNKIKIGQIGIGHNHGSAKMDTFRKLSDLYEVVGVAEPDEKWLKKRQGLDAYKGLKWMSVDELLSYPGLDAVAVETDSLELVPTAIKCVEAGKHIHLDKPGGEDMVLFNRLIDTAKKNARTVQMGYMYRTNAALQLCFKAVREGWLGQVFEIDAVMSRYDGQDYRNWLNGFRGGAFYIFGGHLIDLVVYMLGRPEVVVPFQSRTRPEVDSLYDNGLAVLQYPKTTVTIRTAVVEYDGMKRRQFVVCGDKGTIEIQPIEPPAMRMVLKEAAGGFNAGAQDVELPTPGGRYNAQLTEFARIIRGEIENPFSFEHDTIVQETMLRAAGYTNI